MGSRIRRKTPPAEPTTTPPPVAPVTTPAPATTADVLAAITGGRVPPITYGFKAPAAGPYYAYFQNHGGNANQHTGIDIPGAYGDPIYSPVDGIIVCRATGDGTGAHRSSCDAFRDVGNADPVSGATIGAGRVEVMAEDGSWSLIFGHARMRCPIPNGSRVNRGDQITTIGGANGPHVHYEAREWRNGDYTIVEPLALTARVMDAQALGEPIPAPVGVVTKDTDFRAIGDISVETFVAVAKAVGAPIGDDVLRACWAACRGYTAAAAAQAVKETQFGKTARGRNNATNIFNDAGNAPRDLSSWQEGFRLFAERFRDPSFKGGVYPAGATVERVLVTYMGGPGCWNTRGATCANGERWRPGGEVKAGVVDINLAIQQFIDRVNAYRAIDAGAAQPPKPTPPRFPWPVQWVVPAGSTRAIPLPADVPFVIDLTPVGPNRSGRKLASWDATVQHETGNRRVGADEDMHSRWQDGGTQGHPDGYVGVHFYVGDHRIIQKIPVNEQGVHTGDWRNQRGVAIELVVNADRNAALAERNSLALCAGLTGWAMVDASAADDLYPHRPSGCPAIVNGRGGWPKWERDTDAIIAAGRGAGPAVPPPAAFAEPVPVPKEWDGTDYVAPNGTVFVALRRVFVVSNESGATARQYASPTSPAVRAPLPKGEAFEAHYVVTGDDGLPWLVSRYGSRILALHCAPALSVVAGGRAHADGADVLRNQPALVLDDPYHGLDGTEVAADAPVGTKSKFMAGIEPRGRSNDTEPSSGVGEVPVPRLKGYGAR